MSRNTTSREQDFSDWSSIRLSKYLSDLNKGKNSQDRRVRDRVSEILDKRNTDLESYISNYQEKWLKEWRDIRDFTEDEKSILSMWGRLYDDKYGLLSVWIIQTTLMEITALKLRPERNKDKLKEYVLSIQHQLSNIPQEDKKWVSLPDWWDELSKQYSS